MNKNQAHHVARVHPVATRTTPATTVPGANSKIGHKAKPIRYNSLRFRWLKMKMAIRLFWYNNCYRAVCMCALGYMLFVGRVRIVGVKGFKAAQGKYIKGFVFTLVPATEDPRRYLGFPF